MIPRNVHISYFECGLRLRMRSGWASVPQMGCGLVEGDLQEKLNCNHDITNSSYFEMIKNLSSPTQNHLPEPIRGLN